MAVSFQADEAIDMAAGGAALVANLIAPGSGVVVGKVVKAGGAIIQGLVKVFKRKKSEGKSDADAVRETAAEASPAEIAEIKEAAEAKGAHIKMLGDLTADDKKVSALLKDQKMRGEDGKYTLLELYQKAVAEKRINPAGLFVYAGIEDPARAYNMMGGVNTLVDALGSGSNGVGGANVSGGAAGSSFSLGDAASSGSGFSGAIPGKENTTGGGKSSSSPVLMILLAIIGFLMALPFMLMKPFRRRRRRTNSNYSRPQYNSFNNRGRYIYNKRKRK